MAKHVVFHILTLLLGITQVALSQGNTWDQVRYNGGTLATNVSPKEWDNIFRVTSDTIGLVLKDGQVLVIDPSKVTGLSYGQEAHRRVGTTVALGVMLPPAALFGLFNKSKVHYIGIEYTTNEGKKGGVLLQGHKSNYRAILQALKSVTGKEVETETTQDKRDANALTVK
jgi:hypothetical protein